MKRTYHVYRAGGHYVGPVHNLRQALRIAFSLVRESDQPGDAIASIFYSEGDRDYQHYLRTVYRPGRETK